MDSLRIVLIVLGAILVAGIYLRERSKRRPIAEERVPEPAEDLGLESFRVDGGPAPEEAWGGSGFTARDDEGVVVDEPAAEPETKPAPKPAPGNDVLLLALIVMARDVRFDGRAVLDAAKAAGLHFGRSDIFHYYPDAEGVDDPPWFGVANLLEPGTFDLEHLDERETPGLVFFLQLPGPVPGAVAFERMLGVARAVAAQLGGELHNERREPLDEARLSDLRERVRRFEAGEATRAETEA